MSTPPDHPGRSLIRRLGRAVFMLAFTIVLVGMWAWCVLAIYFSNLPGSTLRVVAAAVFAVAVPAAFTFLRSRKVAVLCFLASFAIVLAWWWMIPASNDRNWQPKHAKMPYAEIDGNGVRIRNIRNTDYRSLTDFDIRYEDWTFDLDDVVTVDFVASDWGLKEIVHTLLSFGLRDGRHLVLSVEPRREKDEPRATDLGSIFKQYELLYVLAGECDVLRVRTNFRKENVYVFPTTMTPAQASEVFMAAIQKINALHEHARYYNLIAHNCTTGLVPLIEAVFPTAPRFNWRYLLNANSVRMSYDDGHIASPLSFERTVEVCHVNQYVEDHPECAGYSQRIRPDVSRYAPPPGP